MKIVARGEGELEGELLVRRVLCLFLASSKVGKLNDLPTSHFSQSTLEQKQRFPHRDRFIFGFTGIFKDFQGFFRGVYEIFRSDTPLDFKAMFSS